MRKLILTFCLTLAVLVGNSGTSFALPECEGSPKSQAARTNIFSTQGYENWSECKSAFTWKNGNKYVGGFWDGKENGQGKFISSSGQVELGIRKSNKFQYAQNVIPTFTAKDSPGSLKGGEVRTIMELLRESDRIEKEKKPKPKPRKIIKKKEPKQTKPRFASSGSGFFVSKLGHVVTNQHVVKDCKKVTVGDNSRKQVPAVVLATDRRNDLALLRISSMKMASAETKALIRKLDIKIVPLSTNGLLRSGDVKLGEDILVAGYPYGETFSNTIKVTKGIVSAKVGVGDDSGEFQIDAAIQSGNSGGPIYDGNGNIVGVVVAQLDKLKVAKAIGSLPENVNFGIKASTVKQFLTSSGLPTKWAKRTKPISFMDVSQIAKNQTVMVKCYE